MFVVAVSATLLQDQRQRSMLPGYVTPPVSLTQQIYAPDRDLPQVCAVEPPLRFPGEREGPPGGSRTPSLPPPHPTPTVAFPRFGGAGSGRLACVPSPATPGL